MNLSKAQREQLRSKYGGRCAYCGDELSKSWQADHVKPVQRISQLIVKGAGKYGKLTYKYTTTGEMHAPENDTYGNLVPACSPCNNDKGSMDLEQWRERLARAPEILVRNYSTYKHALRFGVIQVTNQPVVFYFERRRRVGLKEGR